MGKRGPQSMTTLMIDGSTTTIQRPDAPYDLTDAAADVWKAIVESMPADHFAPSHYPILSQYCRHKVESNRISQLIEQLCKTPEGSKRVFNLTEYNLLTTMQGRESTALNRLARSMRLTHQALYRADSPKSRPLLGQTKVPWAQDD